MRRLLVFLFLATQASAAFGAEVVGRFTLLADNESFGYTLESFQTIRGNDPWPTWMQRITMYAVKNNNPNDITKLFAQEGIITQTVQFSGDFRMAFFLSDRWNSESRPPGHYIYMADGATGEIRRLRTAAQVNIRVTNDGRTAAFIDASLHSDTGERVGVDTAQVNIFIFDIETEIVRELVWRPEAANPHRSWRIFRVGNIFRIIAVASGNGDPLSQAVAELDPATMVLNTLWDLTREVANMALLDENNREKLANTLQHKTYLYRTDDRNLQQWNPNVRLRR